MENSIETIQAAINGAIATRGKNEGRLKAKCPPSNTDAAAAWQALMSYANPHKCGFGTMLLFSKRQMSIFADIDQAIQRTGLDVRSLDRDRVILDSIGVF